LATRSSRFLVSASSLPHFPFVVPSLPKSPHGQDGSPPCADQPHQSTAAVGVPRTAGSKPPRETPDPERGSQTEQGVHRHGGRRALARGRREARELSPGWSSAASARGSLGSPLPPSDELASRRRGHSCSFRPRRYKDEDESGSRLCDSHVAT